MTKNWRPRANSNKIPKNGRHVPFDLLNLLPELRKLLALLRELLKSLHLNLLKNCALFFAAFKSRVTVLAALSGISQSLADIQLHSLLFRLFVAVRALFVLEDAYPRELVLVLHNDVESSKHVQRIVDAALNILVLNLHLLLFVNFEDARRYRCARRMLPVAHLLHDLLGEEHELLLLERAAHSAGHHYLTARSPVHAWTIQHRLQVALPR